MKRMAFLGYLVLFLAPIVFAQDKIEVPVWNVGDKWTFTGNGTVEVMKADANGYTLNFSERICMAETQGYSAILFERASLSRIYSVKGDKRKKYKEGLGKIFDFPLSVGKQWRYNYSGTAQGWGGPMNVDFYENYKILGWEDIGAEAGKFKAVRLEYLRHFITPTGNKTGEIKHLYWYSPDAKYFIKCQYDKDWMKGNKEIFDWELTSFQLKK